MANMVILEKIILIGCLGFKNLESMPDEEIKMDGKIKVQKQKSPAILNKSSEYSIYEYSFYVDQILLNHSFRYIW